MKDKQIVIKDYFNILRDDYGRIYCIQEIGDPKSLIKAIREQNEYIQAKEQENKRLLEIINAKPLETVDIDSTFEIEKLKEQLKRKEQKLDKIQTICEKETTKSTFCNGIENKDLQKLAIKILKIIERKDNE